MNILGTTVENKITSAETGGKYYAFEITIPPGEGVPPHIHTLEDEVLCMINGELEVLLDGKPETATPGTVKNFPMGVPHGFQNNTDQPCSAIVLVTPGESFEQFFKELSEVSRGPDTDMNEVVAITGKFGMTFVDSEEG